MIAVRRATKTDHDSVALLNRCEKGDREAAYDLARVLRPQSVTELVEFVWPEHPPTPEMFDVLADAFNTYTTLEKR